MGRLGFWGGDWALGMGRRGFWGGGGRLGLFGGETGLFGGEEVPPSYQSLSFRRCFLHELVVVETCAISTNKNRTIVCIIMYCMWIKLRNLLSVDVPAQRYILQ